MSAKVVVFLKSVDYFVDFQRSSDDQFMAMASNGGSLMMDVNADAKKVCCPISLKFKS